MTDALRRSFAVTFLDPSDPAAAECLERLDEIAATLERLSDVGLCHYEAVSHEMVRGGIVGYNTVHQFFKNCSEGSDPTRTTGRVMDALFRLWLDAPHIRVRFYCREYQHPQGMCECSRLVWNWNQRRTSANIVYESLQRMAVSWVISRADLLMLTDEQVASVPCHSNTRKNLTDFITWLRANPNAE